MIKISSIIFIEKFHLYNCNCQNCYLLSQSFKIYQKQFLEFSASSGGSAVMNLPEMMEMWVQSLGQKAHWGKK